MTSRKRIRAVWDDAISATPEDTEEDYNAVITKVLVHTVKTYHRLRDITLLQRRKTGETRSWYCSAHGTLHRPEKFKNSWRVNEKHVAIVKQQTGCDVAAGDLVCDAFYHKYLYRQHCCI